jgi:hypothetical protein
MVIIPADIYLKKISILVFVCVFELGFLLFMGVWKLYEIRVLWNTEL